MSRDKEKRVGAFLMAGGLLMYAYFLRAGQSLLATLSLLAFIMGFIIIVTQ